MFAEKRLDADAQYARNVEAAQAFVDRTPAVIKDLLKHTNYVWAAQNLKQAADAHIELGLLHWRRGIDPRKDFEGAFRACSALDELVKKHLLPKDDLDLSLVYAALFLMGRPAGIDYVDVAACTEFRWPAYQYRLVNALHDVAPTERLTKLVDGYLATNNALPDKIFEAYFQLLGLRPSKLDMEERVRRARSTWVERRREALAPEGRPLDGHGVMNDLYVDIYLAAVLKKIGWVGHTVHAWTWG